MVIANVRRKWPRLVREVEREEGKKFKRKPTLTLHNGRPQATQNVIKKKRKVLYVLSAKVKLNRRMCRDNETLAVLTAKHELRESLLRQHEYGKTKAQKRAQKHEKADRKKLGLKKSYGWLARGFFGS
jgi:hypothetical protein